MREKTLGLSVLLLGLAAALALLYQPKAESASTTPPAPAVTEKESTPHPAEPVANFKIPEPTPLPPPVVENEPEQSSHSTEITTSQIPLPTPPTPTPEVLPKVPLSEPHLQIVNSGPTSAKQIAITFDDGPHPVLTLKVLDVLREHKVKATFFVLGDCVKRYPWILRQIVAEGHEVGNHTYHHCFLTPMSNELIGREITETQDAIRNAIGYETSLFRPPYGAFRNDTKAVFKEQHLSVVLWNVDPKDWRSRNREKIFTSVTNQTRNGSIILCHDIQKATVEALPAILDTLQAQGYSFSTVSQLCGLPPLKLVTSPVTTSTAQVKPQ